MTQTVKVINNTRQAVPITIKTVEGTRDSRTIPGKGFLTLLPCQLTQDIFDKNRRHYLTIVTGVTPAHLANKRMEFIARAARPPARPNPTTPVAKPISQ